MKTEQDIILLGLENIIEFEKEHNLYELINLYSDVKSTRNELNKYFDENWESFEIEYILDYDTCRELIELGVEYPDYDILLILNVIDKFLNEIYSTIVKKIENLKKNY